MRKKKNKTLERIKVLALPVGMSLVVCLFLVFAVNSFQGETVTQNIQNYYDNRTKTAEELAQEKTEFGAWRTNQPERQVYSTSTSGNTSDILWSNVEDFDAVGVTLAVDTDSGRFRLACSMQETSPTLAASSTSNRYDYVDFIDTSTETSINGWTGVTFTSSSVVQQYTIRNSVWKWCVPVYTALVDTNSGIGTTTIYLKQVDNL